MSAVDKIKTAKRQRTDVVKKPKAAPKPKAKTDGPKKPKTLGKKKLNMLDFDVPDGEFMPILFDESQVDLKRARKIIIEQRNYIIKLKEGKKKPKIAPKTPKTKAVKA